MICKSRGWHLRAQLSIVACLYRWRLLAYAARPPAVEALAAGMIVLSLLRREDISTDPQPQAETARKCWRFPGTIGGRRIYFVSSSAYLQEKALPVVVF
jgi:hypothetical protein